MMIWLIALILAVLTALLLVRPLLPAKTQTAKTLVSVFMLLFVGAAIGIYARIGSPSLSDPANLQTASTPEAPDISAMVEGLALRLADNPDDPEGWTRLIRSRIVLGDFEGLIREHQQMRNVYKDRPEVITKISEESGFNALSQELLTEE
ncbi:hypothetical protein ACJ3XI_09300 [Litorimonas sp. RW-G-Af-16]|uniref:hypothetical protein n=1 Tax=Litorimonas sp. RW-G-Af-16 TaxID=3241168 RepID=UPI00390C7EE9